MSIESLLARYLSECDRLGVHGEIRAVEQQRAEIVARNGTVESEGLTTESVISLTVSDGTGWAVLAGGTDVDPATMVAEGHALLRSTSGQADGRAPAGPSAPGTGTHPGRRVPISENRDRLGAISVLPVARECEVRSVETTRTVHFATPEGTQTYPTSHASVVFRATRSDPDGEPVHVDRGDSGPDLDGLLDQLAERDVRDCSRELLAAEFPASADLPATVVIGRHVAAQLLWLFGEALSGEAVVQRRSRLADQLGQQVSSPLVTITDDPFYPGGPRYLPIDDEGIAGERRVLIDRGQLRAFLGSRGYQCEGAGRQRAATGRGRAAEAGREQLPGPPRPGAGHSRRPHLVDHPDPRHAPVQSDHGRLLDRRSRTGPGRSDRAWRAAGLTVAGNVFDVFRNTDAVGAQLCWVDDAESSFGSPDLLVSGLTIGR